jgi:hypothetical protein
MIASLHDENNHITIPGFMTMSKNYLLKKELKWQKPFSLENIKKALDLKTSMAKNYITNERNSIRNIGRKRNLGWLYWCRSKNGYRKSSVC